MSDPGATDGTDDGPPDAIFIRSARRYVAATAGLGVRRITLLLTDGTRRRIDVVAIDTAPPWPPAEGWSLRGNRASFDGQVFRLAGKPLAIFRALLTAGENWIPHEILKRDVWDAFTEDKTVQNAVSKLRKEISVGLGITFEPRMFIESCDEAYRLDPPPMRRVAESA